MSQVSPCRTGLFVVLPVTALLLFASCKMQVFTGGTDATRHDSATSPDPGMDAGMPDPGMDAGMPDAGMDAVMPEPGTDAGLPVNNPQPVVTISATAHAAEPSTNGGFTVTLSETSPVDTVISFTVGGTATPGADYMPLGASVTIPANQSAATIPVAVIDDATEENSETVSVMLSGFVSGNSTVVLGSPSTATVDVVSDETPGDVDLCIDQGGATGDGEVTGDLITWHPLEVTFVGPSSDEAASQPNPFLDYRLQVLFRGPDGVEYDVPGFFDGDGAGGGTGNRWRARFSPDLAGEWTYIASFRRGAGVAVDLDAGAGTATDFDGASGTFCVEPPDSTAVGFLGHGRLEYVGAHHLRLSDGTWWIKAGADSPENFLGYAGFDNTIDQAGGVSTDGLVDGLHRYEPHVDDWKPGDPDWSDGAGRGIIGALNYLASEEVNSIYFLPCNLGGDGRETYPYINPADLLHFDVSKLRQWEIVFDHAQRKGIALHFVLNETESENENLHDGGRLGLQRKVYYRELNARFGHHLAVVWNIGEENDYGNVKQIEFAGYIRAVDPYDHPMTVHTNLDQTEAQYAGLVGRSEFDITSIQLSPTNAGRFVEQWREESAAAGRPWAVMLDEISPAGTGVTDTNAPEIRRKTLWPALLSGSGGVEWYFGYHPLPLGGDLQCEDFRTREEMWLFTRIARRFLMENMPFWEMQPHDALLTGETGDGHVFKKANAVYAVYLSNASGSPVLDLSEASGNFEIKWFDPRSGAFAVATRAVAGGGTISLGSPPTAPTEDWVVLLQGGSGIPPPPPPPPPSLTVIQLVLIDADSDSDLGLLADGDAVDLSVLPSRNLNVRAVTAPATVGSVRFGFDGNSNYRVENSAPYSLAGDVNGDYNGWTPSAGMHTLTVTPYANPDTSGATGATMTVHFTVVD